MKIINKLITILNIIKKLIIILKIILFSIVIYLLIKLILIIINNTTDISTSFGCLSIFYKRRKRIDYSILNHWKQMDEENILFENNNNINLELNSNLIVNKGKTVKYYKNISNFNRDKELPPIPMSDETIRNSFNPLVYDENNLKVYNSMKEFIPNLLSPIVSDYSPSLNELELLKTPKNNNIPLINSDRISHYWDEPYLSRQELERTPRTLRKKLLNVITEINSYESFIPFFIIIKDKLIKVIKSLIYLFITKIIFIIKLITKFIMILIKRLFIIFIIIHIKKFFVLIDYNVIFNYPLIDYINMINNSVIVSYILWIKNLNEILTNKLKILYDLLIIYEIRYKDKINKFSTMILVPIEIPDLILDTGTDSESNSDNERDSDNTNSSNSSGYDTETFLYFYEAIENEENENDYDYDENRLLGTDLLRAINNHEENNSNNSNNNFNNSNNNSNNSNNNSNNSNNNSSQILNNDSNQENKNNIIDKNNNEK